MSFRCKERVEERDRPRCEDDDEEEEGFSIYLGYLARTFAGATWIPAESQTVTSRDFLILVEAH